MKHIFSTVRWVLPLAILLALLNSFSVRPAFAGGVVGNGTPASCTFSAFATALQGGGLVTFNCGPAPHTIEVSGVRDIGVNTTIDGGNRITLSAVAFHFQVIDEKKLILKNIKLADGKHSITGGIENYGIVKAVNVTFHKNTSTSDGGAIVNYGKLVVNKSTFTKNRATLSGGAIANLSGDAKIKNSTFKDNRATGGSGKGGAIANHDGDLFLIGSTLRRNRAYEGGAVWTDANTTNTLKKSALNANRAGFGAGLENRGNIEIVSSTLSNNIADNHGGGIANYGFMIIAQSTLQGNQAGGLGGGIIHTGSSLFVNQSTLNSNTAGANGGGVYSIGDASVENSTLSGNSAGSSGGGWLQSTYTATFQFVTIANNSGTSGGAIHSAGSINLRHTVLSNNTGGNCTGTNLVSNGYNLSTDTSCSFLTQTGDQNNKRARLGALANNGGPTQTHLPGAGSRLINKGSGDQLITVDQRNLPRPVGSKSDIGSVEVQ
jgi:predicted outer membrane repeat protein